MSREKRRARDAEERDRLLSEVKFGRPFNTRANALDRESDNSQLISQSDFVFVLDANDKPRFQFFTSSFGPGSHLP